MIEFINLCGKPHKLASSDAISQWIKYEFGKAGVNTNVYTAHSCRAASTSKARHNGVSINEILKRGYWKTENTFRTFYSRDIINENSKEGFDFVQPYYPRVKQIYDGVSKIKGHNIFNNGVYDLSHSLLSLAFTA